jgi:hypothetical protein
VQASVKVKGLRELRSALGKGTDALKRLDEELVKAAEPVAREAIARGSRYQGIGPFKARRKKGGVIVGQSKRKVTGLRGDFGSTQMRTVLLPALEAKRPEVEDRVEDWLGGMFRRVDLS